MSALRVLCVTPWFPNDPADGKYNFIYHSVLALVNAGHDVRVVVTRPWIPPFLARVSADWAHTHAGLQRAAFNGLAIELIQHTSLPRYALAEQVDSLYRSWLGSRVKRIASAWAPQIIHAHTERTGFAVQGAAKAAKVPSVVTLHGVSTAPQLLDTETKRARLRDTLSGASRVVLVGEPLRAHYAPLAGSDGNFRVVPNGFHLHDGSSTGWAKTDTVRFVSVGNLEEGKGIEINLEALARLNAEGLNRWTYSVVGGGAQRAALEGVTDRLRLRSQVTFHGALPHAEALRTLSQADVFTLPSYREAFGVAYLEAMASGLLAIGVEGQGPSAFITHERTGLLVQPKSVDSLVAALRFAFDRRTDAQRVAMEGQRHARAEFTWARHADKLAAVYAEALAS